MEFKDTKTGVKGLLKMTKAEALRAGYKFVIGFAATGHDVYARLTETRNNKEIYNCVWVQA